MILASDLRFCTAASITTRLARVNTQFKQVLINFLAREAQSQAKLISCRNGRQRQHRSELGGSYAGSAQRLRMLAKKRHHEQDVSEHQRQTDKHIKHQHSKASARCPQTRDVPHHAGWGTKASAVSAASHLAEHPNGTCEAPRGVCNQCFQAERRKQRCEQIEEHAHLLTSTLALTIIQHIVQQIQDLSNVTSHTDGLARGAWVSGACFSDVCSYPPTKTHAADAISGQF